MATDFSLHIPVPSREDRNLYSLVSPEIHTREPWWIDEHIVGTWAYDSKVSGQQERHPVAAGLMGASGLDFELITLVHDFLHGTNLPKAVYTGREVLESTPKKGQPKLNPPAYNLHGSNSFELGRKLSSTE